MSSTHKSTATISQVAHSPQIPPQLHPRNRTAVDSEAVESAASRTAVDSKAVDSTAVDRTVVESAGR